MSDGKSTEKNFKTKVLEIKNPKMKQRNSGAENYYTEMKSSLEKFQKQIQTGRRKNQHT